MAYVQFGITIKGKSHPKSFRYLIDSIWYLIKMFYFFWGGGRGASTSSRLNQFHLIHCMSLSLSLSYLSLFMSLGGPPLYYFLCLSSVSRLNMEGGAGAALKGRGEESCWAILRFWFVKPGPRALNLVV